MLPSWCSLEPHVVHGFQYKPHMVHLQKRLAKFIKEKRGDISQREFARKIGVSQASITRIENHEQNVTLDTLEHICKYYRVDIADLFPSLQTPTVYPNVGSDAGSRPSALLHEKEPDHKTP
jgi:transcriptional regulator with XRE-family HTH domain